MKIIKVNQSYYNLNQFEQYNITDDGLLSLNKNLDGTLYCNHQDNEDLFFSSEVRFLIKNQAEFARSFEAFLSNNDSLVDFSSLLEIYHGDKGQVAEYQMNSESIKVIDTTTLEAAKMIIIHQQASASLIQRKLQLGYNRAGRIIDQLEELGIIGPFNGSSARAVNINDVAALSAHIQGLGVKIVDTIE
jgi:DNA segregation ATPase FtsK/SpoIIIE-like protein